MQLTAVHSDPQLLADFLQVPFEPETRSEATWYSRRCQNTVTITAEQRAYSAYGDYVSGLRADFNKSAANPWKEQTHAQFIAECLKYGLGIKAKGKVSERLAYAKMARRDLYAD